ncbi:MAG: alpha/beta hydrolase, partial [Blastocatellia bacterium]
RTLLVIASAVMVIGANVATLHRVVSASPVKQQADKTKEKAADRPRTLAEIVAMPVVYSVPGMDRVTVKKDLSYKRSDDPNLKMDVYLPPGLPLKERRPAVLFIHGGAASQLRAKDWGIYVSYGKLMAASGLAAVTFTHRLGYPKTLITEGASDVSDAIAYVRANADSLQIDRDRLCLAAFSAGGPMLSIAMRDKPEYVRCIAAVYAFLDIQQSEIHRQHETPETIKRFSPITYIDGETSRLPPIFVALGGRDAIATMNDSIDRFVHEAIAKNAAIEFMNHPNGVHGFDSQNDDDRSREIIRRMIDFMKTHLGVK